MSASFAVFILVLGNACSLPARRLGVPDDIAGVASFLCSDDARFITGETIVAAGGAQSRL